MLGISNLSVRSQKMLDMMLHMRMQSLWNCDILEQVATRTGYPPNWQNERKRTLFLHDPTTHASHPVLMTPEEMWFDFIVPIDDAMRKMTILDDVASEHDDDTRMRTQRVGYGLAFKGAIYDINIYRAFKLIARIPEIQENLALSRAASKFDI